MSRVAPYLMGWEHIRRIYVWAMTRHQLGLLRRHRDILFGEESLRRFGAFDVKKIFAATSLLEIDRHYSYRRAGYDSWEEYYVQNSCKTLLKHVSSHMFFSLFTYVSVLVEFYVVCRI